jgi:hypothetical protein
VVDYLPRGTDEGPYLPCTLVVGEYFQGSALKNIFISFLITLDIFDKILYLYVV